MTPLAWSWLGFLFAWKFLPSRQDDLTNADIALSAAFLLALGLILYPSEYKDKRALCYVLPFFAVAFIARAQLGSNWGIPAKRVTTGLYAFISHPIYASIFVAGVVSAYLSQSKTAIIGVGLLAATLASAAYVDEAKLKELGQ